MPHPSRRLFRTCTIMLVAAAVMVLGLYSSSRVVADDGAGGLNHFLCYQISRGVTRETVDLTTSQFGSTSAVVRRAQRLCAPANKEGEDPTAPADPDHLTGYSLRTQVPFGAQSDQVVVNQFGTLTVDLIPPTFLFVPTGKSTSGPPASYTPAIDHFECFRTVHARFKKAGIGVEDQFATRTVNVRRPTRLCVPVDKDGSGITDPSASLMCYRVSGRPRINNTHVFTTNQFGNDEYDVGVVRELCLPSQLNPGGPTATPVATETATPEPGATATETPEPSVTATPEPSATGTLEPSATTTPEPSATETATPEPTATATPGCGNGLIDAGEDCDDGNTDPCDGCSPTCTTESCGDGTMCASQGETCDDGNTAPCDGCSIVCTIESCGDGSVCPNEACDPPGSICNNGRTCDGTCSCPTPTCGDGFIDIFEDCDDGNTTDGDCCSATCHVESCDDGFSCTADSCDPGTGCVHDPNHTVCDDADEFTVDTCDPNCNPNFATCDAMTGCKHEGGGCS